jgi:hypothetical protein
MARTTAPSIDATRSKLGIGTAVKRLNR